MDAGSRKVEGDLRSFSIFDITQMLLSGRKTAYVSVEAGEKRGFLNFVDGQVSHAMTGSMDSGEKAVFAIFTWRSGTFTIDFEPHQAERNIHSPTDYLLLEVARNLDEVSRDHEGAATPPSETAVTAGVEERLDQRLKSQLKSVFRKVAANAEPARARYTKNAFDGLLRTLVTVKGSTLFLRSGWAPRIKGQDGVITTQDAVVDTDEIRGFLNTLLSETEKTQLRETKEVTTFHDGGELGTFRVTALEDHGSPVVMFVPSRKDIPPLETSGLGSAGSQLAAITDGLVLIAGPLGCGKSTALASILQHHLKLGNRFGVLFATGQNHAFAGDASVLVRRNLPAIGTPFLAGVRSALEQQPDLLAIDPIRDTDSLRLALEVARTGRLVLATIASMSPNETLSRLQQVATDDAGERLGRLIADSLRAVVDLPPWREQKTSAPSVMMIGREEQDALDKLDFAGLRRTRTQSRQPVA